VEKIRHLLSKNFNKRLLKSTSKVTFKNLGAKLEGRINSSRKKEGKKKEDRVNEIQQQQYGKNLKRFSN